MSSWKWRPFCLGLHLWMPLSGWCNDNNDEYLGSDKNTVFPKKYARGFVVLCFVVVMQSFIMNSHEAFIHIHQGCFAGTGAIVRLPQCQWSKPDGYGKISPCITATKHSKAKTVCIFLGIYCISPQWIPSDLTLQWRHDKRGGISNHQPHDYSFDRFFRRRSKKTSKLRVTGLCGGNSPVTDGFHSQRASHVENASIYWRNHAAVSLPTPPVTFQWNFRKVILKLILLIRGWGISRKRWMSLEVNIVHVSLVPLEQYSVKLPSKSSTVKPLI